MSTYLELCQETARECDIGSGVPTAVTRDAAAGTVSVFTRVCHTTPFVIVDPEGVVLVSEKMDSENLAPSVMLSNRT